MKFSEAYLDTQYRITAYETDFIQVNHTRLSQPFLITANVLEPNWVNKRFTELVCEDLLPLWALKADVIIIGSGWQYHTPNPALYRALVESQRGFEIMDTAAACRTFNLLLTETRAVAAALFL